jgi:hypothetical protein
LYQGKLQAVKRRAKTTEGVIKSDRGKVSEAQRDWLDALQAVPGVETFVWYPSDWLSGRVEEVLR